MRELVREGYLERLYSLRDRPDLIKIVTGVRGSGKTTILGQLRKRLESEGCDVLYLGMELTNLTAASERELYDCIAESMPPEEPYVLLDEIHRVNCWEKVVEDLRANGANVYIAGSDAKVRSSDFATVAGGGCIEIHVLPLSFKEFLTRYPPDGSERTERRFDQYLLNGGLPIVDMGSDCPDKRRTILEGMYYSIVVHDVAVRSGTDIGTAKRLTSFLCSNIGNFTTAKSLIHGSGISDRRTLNRYLDAVLDSFVFYRVDAYDLVGKQMMKAKAKYYMADIGLRNAVSNRRTNDPPGSLENIVFLELKRRGYDVAVGKYRDYEVDFIAWGSGYTGYFQIAPTLDDDFALRRKTRPLRLLKDAGEKTVLTLDRELPEDADGIRYVNLVDWLQSDGEPREEDSERSEPLPDI